MKLLESKEYSCVYRDGEAVVEKRRMLKEHSLSLNIGGKMEVRLACSPRYLEELVVGYLYTEGIVAAEREIESITISDDGRRAEVSIKQENDPSEPNGVKLGRMKPDRMKLDRMKQDRTEKRKMTPLSPVHWETEWIFRLADRFAEGMPLHQETWATHSCFLARGPELLFACEDIGRHNAFDKTVGYALRRGIDLSECIVYSSGRVPVDMVEKAVLAGIPVFAAKAAPTAEAVDLARSYGLTLIGAARQDSMRVYTDFNMNHSGIPGRTI